MKTLRLLSLSVVLASALGALACSADPAVAKREFLAEGNKYFEQGRYSEASINYRKAIQEDQLFADAHYKLAQTYDKLGDGLGAAREYIRAADLMPDNPDAQTRAGVFLLAGGSFEDAKSRAVKALQKNPKHIDAHLLLAQAMAGMRDLNAAVENIQDTIRMDPSDARPVSSLAGFQLAQGNLPAAEAQFKRAVEVDPKSVYAAMSLGRFYLSTARPAEAEQWLKKAVAIAPTDSVANRSLAALYLSTNRIAEAEAPLKASLQPSVPADKLNLADYYFAAGRHGDTTAVLESLKDDPTVFTETRLRFSILEWREGRGPKAYERVDEILAKSPKDPTANLLKGRYLILDRQFTAGRDLLKKSVDADPRRPSAHYWLGTAYRSLGDLDSAIKEFAEAEKLAPADMGPKLQLAQLNLAASKLDAAETFARGAVQAQPRNGEARLTLVDVLIARGKEAEALKEATFLATSLPKLPEPHVALGRIYLKQANYAAAERAFQRGIELSNGSIESIGGLVDTLIAAGKIPDARNTIETRLARNSNDVPLMLVAARVYRAAKDERKAEATLKEALATDANNLAAYVELSRIYIVENRLDEARSQLEAIAAKQPKAIWAPTLIGMSLHIQNRRAEAKERYERILRIEPTAAVAANNLATLLLEEGHELDRAVALAQTATRGLPDNPDVNDTLGWAYVQKNLPALAVPAFEKALRAQPNNAVFHYHLGSAYLAAGDKAKARESLSRALDLKLGSQDAAKVKSLLATLGAQAKSG
jgi:tetratricopeptide (TPR) repeat protein